MKKSINPIMGIWFGALCTSFAATFIIASGEAPFVVAFYRLLFAVAFLLPVNALQGWDQLRQISRNQLLSCLIAGLFFALHLVTYIGSLQYTSVASAGALLSLQPVFTAVGAFIFLREQIDFRVKLGIALAVAGGLIVGGGDLLIVTGSALIGDVLAAVSALMISLYFVAGRSLRQHLDIVPYLVVVYGSAAIATAVISGASGISLTISTTRGWIFLLALGLISTAVGHGIFNWALKYVKASTVALVTLASPAAETVWAYIFLGQVPAITSIVGGIIMITGAVLAVSGEKEEGAKG
ncbi:MAG: DMT family transporter [Firmicutes bacterium]|jgi:drug/metabolite transporter (DMT)-like permease|nr:DMT family transporter [Bacillota bacterium]